MPSSDVRNSSSIPHVIDTVDNGGGKGKVSNKGEDAKLQKKMSRRGSAHESGYNDNRPRRKRSTKRLPGELTASLPSKMPSGNALERFNSLTLDEKIALKLSSKFEISDDEDSSCSSDREELVSAGNNSYEGLRCAEETKGEVLDSAKINSDVSREVSIKSSMASSSPVVISERSNALDSYEARLRRKLSGEAITTKPSVTQKLPDTWSCKNCTYANKSNLTACAMCQEPKGSAGISTSNLTQSVGVYPNATSRSVWKCNACTYKDNAASALRCEVCDQPKNSNSVETSENSGTLPGAYHVPGIRSDLWECKTCTYKDNKMTSLECEMCHALNPNNNPTINHGHDSISGWKCLTCTYQNLDSMSMFCGACGASR